MVCIDSSNCQQVLLLTHCAMIRKPVMNTIMKSLTSDSTILTIEHCWLLLKEQIQRKWKQHRNLVLVLKVAKPRKLSQLYLVGNLLNFLWFCWGIMKRDNFPVYNPGGLTSGHSGVRSVRMGFSQNEDMWEMVIWDISLCHPRDDPENLDDILLSGRFDMIFHKKGLTNL